MYGTKTRVTRGSDKAKIEEYLVIADDSIIAEGLLAIELTGTKAESTHSLVKMNYNAIFETGDGAFYKIKIESEDVDSKVSSELFLQEASDFANAYNLIKKNVPYGTIKDFNETKLMGIVKEEV